MSVEALALVLHHSRAVGTDKVVLMGIANHEGDGGAWPSLTTLARYANVTQRAVRSSIRKLETMRELWVGDQQGGTKDADPRYRTNLYRILLRCPADCDGTSQHRVGDKGGSVVPPSTDPGRKSSAPREEVQRAPGGKHASAEPSLEPSLEPPAVDKSTSAPDWAKAIVNEWWESLDPKPAQSYMSVVKIVATLRAKGWTSSEVARALRDVPTVTGPALDMWRNRRRAASGVQAAADVDERVADEFERAIAAGDAPKAWAMLRAKARSSGRSWFDRVAAALDVDTPLDIIPRVVKHAEDGTPVTGDEIAQVIAAHAEIERRCRGEPPLGHVPAMVEVGNPTKEDP